MGAFKTCCGFYCAMTAAVGVYFFFILGIMEFKGNSFVTNVLQYVPCEGYDELTLTCPSGKVEQINKDTKGIAFMITACIELILVFACYMCGKSSMEADEAKEEADRQHMISTNYNVPQ